MKRARAVFAVNATEGGDRVASTMGRIARLFGELGLTKNEGWLVALELCCSIGAGSGMTLEQMQERVAKAFDVYRLAYRGHSSENAGAS